LESRPPTSSPASSASTPTTPGRASPKPEADEIRAAETADALRRTRLASERTYLAWWRTGLTAVAVGIGAGGIAPKLVGGERWAYVAVGCGYAALGIASLGYGLYRQLVVDRRIAEGGFASADPRVLAALSAAGALLAVLTIVLLVTSL
jgi:putative membrane protein